MRKLIRVTKEHIRNGSKHSNFNCPIALALKENGVAGGFVSALPRSVYRFIHRFDSGKTVKPFNFYYVYMNCKTCYNRKGLDQYA